MSTKPGLVGLPDRNKKNEDVLQATTRSTTETPTQSTNTATTTNTTTAPATTAPASTYSYTVNSGNQPYIDQLNQLYDRIVNRKPFSYDVNADALYKQLADQYTQMGKMASRDVQGQAAALTGGYGNSYAAQVGNQAYQQYLTALTGFIPDLYNQAQAAHQNELSDLLQQYQLMSSHPGVIDSMKPRTITSSVDNNANSFSVLNNPSSILSNIYEKMVLNGKTAEESMDNMYEDWLKRLTKPD